MRIVVDSSNVSVYRSDSSSIRFFVDTSNVSGHTVSIGYGALLQPLPWPEGIRDCCWEYAIDWSHTLHVTLIYGEGDKITSRKITISLLGFKHPKRTWEQEPTLRVQEGAHYTSFPVDGLRYEWVPDDFQGFPAHKLVHQNPVMTKEATPRVKAKKKA